MITLPSGEVCSTGTLTHGTMRSYVVIPSLGSWLAAYATGEVRERYRGIVEDSKSDESASAVMTGVYGAECEFADEIISDFIDLINESLPYGWTCATHPGDGSEIGIWPNTMLDD